MTNILMVESKNDQYFIEALVKQIKASINQVNALDIQEYELLDGLDPKKIENALKNLKSKAEKGQVDQVGIILDIDQEGEASRLEFLNQCLCTVFKDTLGLKQTCEFIQIEQESPAFSIQVACYFTHIEGHGELETLLKTIKAQPSPYADCLTSWRTCLQTQGKNISDKEFNKFWVAQYLRWDTCNLEERKQAGKKCSMAAFEYVMQNKPQIWDLNHSALEDLKQFLQLFVESPR